MNPKGMAQFANDLLAGTARAQRGGSDEEPHGTDAEDAPRASAQIVARINAAIARNPRCAMCECAVTDPTQASYLPAIDRVVHVGACQEVALRRLVGRLERTGRL